MEAIDESVFGGIGTPYRPASSQSPSMRRISLTHNTISHVHFVSQLARGNNTAVVSIQVKDNPMDPKAITDDDRPRPHTLSECAQFAPLYRSNARWRPLFA